MLEIIDLILIALFIEAIVDSIKPIWAGKGNGLSAAEWVAMGIGVVLAVACKINMLAYVVDIKVPVVVEYIFYSMTGIAIGRGTNFLHDLWNKMKQWLSGNILNGVDAAPVLEEYSGNLNIDNWSMEYLQAFCADNMIDTTDCKERKDFIHAIKCGMFLKVTEPPIDSGEE